MDIGSILKLFLILYLSIPTEQATVHAPNGAFEGKKLTTKDNIKYYSFTGIKYGKVKRFEPPQAIKPYSGLYNAKNKGYVCYQLAKNKSYSMSEDCLYLNIYTPNFRFKPWDKKAAVMFFIHGGFFFKSGNARHSTLPPDNFIQDNVVLVTVQYRLGVFGFLSTGNELLPGNYGLKDLALALKWVKTNIASFGGDQNRVTIFGQNGGGALTSYLTYSPLTYNKDLFQNAIFQSGVSLNLWSLQNKPLSVFENIAKLVGCNESHLEFKIEEAVSCIETAPAKKIHSAISKLSNAELSFAPVIEPNIKGAAITEEAYSILQKKDFKMVPFINGITSEEALFIADTFSVSKSSNNLKYIKQIKLLHNIESKNIDIYGMIRTYYFGDSNDVVLSKLITLCSDILWRQPAFKFNMLIGDRIPNYLYILSRNNKKRYKKIDGLGTVSHGADLQYLFNARLKNKTKVGVSNSQNNLTEKRIIRLWTNFAKYGNPTSNISDNVLQDFQWTPTSIDQNVLRYLDIGDELGMKTYDNVEMIQFWDTLYENIRN